MKNYFDASTKKAFLHGLDASTQEVPLHGFDAARQVTLDGFLLTFFHRRRGQPGREEAEGLYRRVIEIRPTHGAAHFNYAFLKQAVNQIDRHSLQHALATSF